MGATASDIRNAICIQTATADITPPESCELGGYAVMRRWNRVEQPLEANIVMFDDGEQRVYLVALDTLYVGAEIEAFLGEVATFHASGRPARVIASASHTHFAPMLDRSKPQLGTADPGYIDVLKTRLSAAFEALAPPFAAALRACEGTADASVHRRLRSSHRTWNNGFRTSASVFMAPNPSGFVDRRIRIFEFRNEQNEAKAALVHFACHPSSFPEVNAVTPDYIGGIRAAIREKVGGDIPVVFLQGCAGDVRASAIGAPSLLSWLRTIKFGPHFIPASQPRWNAWLDRMKGRVREILADGPEAQPLRGTIAGADRRFPLERLRNTGPGQADVELGYLEIGGDIRILTFNAEPLAQWTHRFDPSILITGYVGDCFGYLPVESDLAQGGYEVEGHASWLELPTLAWKPGFEQRVIEEAALLSDRLSPLPAAAE